MMAAISAAESLRAQGLKGNVVLLEKNDRLGRKLLLTGNGRCNLTNLSFLNDAHGILQISDEKGAGENEEEHENIRSFCQKFGRKGRFLITAMESFGVKKTLSLFQDHGLDLKSEAGGRVFPRSDRAYDVLDVLTKQLDELNVDVKLNTKVTGFFMEPTEHDATTGGEGERDAYEQMICAVRCIEDGVEQEIQAQKVIVCTGGMSYPSTGSSGDGFSWTKTMGHTIVKPSPGLTSVKIGESWIRELQGVSLEDVMVTVSIDEGKPVIAKGGVLFTQNGMSGPAIMEMSSNIGTLIDRCAQKEKENVLDLQLDFLPRTTNERLDEMLVRTFAKDGNRQVSNCLEGEIPKRLISHILQQLKIDPEMKMNNITKDDRKRLVSMLRSFPMTITGLSGFERAMITIGGVSLKEIDPKTMKSKLIENLYLCGELIDLDGPTGGYNLQVCWSTGHLAGASSAVGR